MCVGILKLNENWLANRRQSVVENIKILKWIQATSGVPQGFLLGPTVVHLRVFST